MALQRVVHGDPLGVEGGHLLAYVLAQRPRDTHLLKLALETVRDFGVAVRLMDAIGVDLAKGILDLSDVRRHQRLKSSDYTRHLLRVLRPKLLTLLLQLLDLGPVAPLKTTAHLRVLVK